MSEEPTDSQTPEPVAEVEPATSLKRKSDKVSDSFESHEEI